MLRLSAPSRGREGDAGVPHELTNWEQMSQWSVEDVLDFMKASDLEGPGGVLVANGFRRHIRRHIRRRIRRRIRRTVV